MMIVMVEHNTQHVSRNVGMKKVVGSILCGVYMKCVESVSSVSSVCM